MEPAQQYRDMLKSKGRKLSPHVAAVVDVVFSLLGTFDSEEVVARLRGQASRATVFRTLASLVEADLLRQVQFNGRQVFVATAESDSIGSA